MIAAGMVVSMIAAIGWLLLNWRALQARGLSFERKMQFGVAWVRGGQMTRQSWKVVTRTSFGALPPIRRSVESAINAPAASSNRPTAPKRATRPHLMPLRGRALTLTR